MYVSTRLGRWFYEERGAKAREDDPAIVLLHGLLFDGDQWRGQIGPLAALGRVIVIDGPGHGRSEVPPPFSLEDHARALVDALDALKVPRAVLVGLSWGGMLSMRVAIEHASRVAAMALIDTSGAEESRASRIKYRLFVAFAQRFGLPRRMLETQVAPLMFCPKTLAAHPEWVDRLTHTVNGYPRLGVVRASKAVVIERKNVLARLGDVKVPTLVVCGREDAATVPAHSEALAAHIAGARLEWIEGAGHMTALEQPEALNDLLVPFVREHLRAPPS